VLYVDQGDELDGSANCGCGFEMVVVEVIYQDTPVPSNGTR
jgi:hypothetical protein